MEAERDFRCIATRWFSAMWDKDWTGGGWFRLFGYGIGVIDHRETPPLFSERYNGQHGVRRRVFWHVGPYCVRFLRPWRLASTTPASPE